MGKVVCATGFYLADGFQQLQRVYLVNRTLAKGREDIALKAAFNIAGVVFYPCMQLLVVPLQRHSLKGIYISELLAQVGGFAFGGGIEVGLQLLA